MCFPCLQKPETIFPPPDSPVLWGKFLWSLMRNKSLQGKDETHVFSNKASHVFVLLELDESLWRFLTVFSYLPIIVN